MGYNGEVCQGGSMDASARRNHNNGSINVVAEACKLFILLACFNFVIICAKRASHLFCAEWRRMDVGPLLSESASWRLCASPTLRLDSSVFTGWFLSKRTKRRTPWLCDLFRNSHEERRWKHFGQYRNTDIDSEYFLAIVAFRRKRTFWELPSRCCIGEINSNLKLHH
jgi:hypothetical protein